MDNSWTLYSLLFLSMLLWAEADPIYLKTNTNYNEHITNSSNKLDCNSVEYSGKDAVQLKNNVLFLKSKKLLIKSGDYERDGQKIYICSHIVDAHSENEALNCKDKFGYGSDEYEILQNGSVLVEGQIITKEQYMFDGEELLTCVPDYTDDPENETSADRKLDAVSIHVGKIGSGISIVALSVHLLTFCFLPNLRNLPGYNLASLSVAFLLAYSFVLIGQIPEVLGLFCVISAILQQNFFLAAFFCMNVLAFDVWRTLKLATEKLVVGSQNTRKRQFLWYSLYAWGSPLFVTVISVIIDNIDGVPDEIKPFYGKNDTCWLTNNIAKTVFFAAPAFTLFIINAIFFLSSSCMISSNTMKFPSEHNKQTVKLNYILYVRLAIMMGLTWLTGIIALITKHKIAWFIFDMLNSLQGLFLFLLFTCTRKVMKHLIEKTNSKKRLSDKLTTVSSNSSNFTSRN